MNNSASSVERNVPSLLCEWYWVRLSPLKLMAGVLRHTFDGTGLILLCSCLRFRVWIHRTEVSVFYVSIRATENYEFGKIRTTGVTENATNYKNSHGDNSIRSTRQGRRLRGDSGARPPYLKSVPPHFTFGPPVAAFIQYCIVKMWTPFCFFAPPSGFWSPCC